MLLWTLAFAADRRTPVVAAVEIATPSVVTVDVASVQRNPFFGWEGVTASAGSGVVIDARGLVVTNAHVVDGARSVTVHAADGGGSWLATVVALDREVDLAVLKVDATLPAATLADSDALLLGETAIAIGNPLGLGLTVSTGVVSSRDRDVEIRPGLHQSFIQTDAAINPGNSGGALVDLDGRVIGINTAIRQDAEGIGFAIPANRVRKIVTDLVSFGAVRIPWLGLAVVDLDARGFQGSAIRSAVLVKGVAAGGPAERAGVEPGDLLIEIDGRAIGSRADLNSRLASHQPGDTVALGVWHRDARREVAVRSAELPEDAGQAALRAGLGISVVPATGGLRVSELVPGRGWSQAQLAVDDLLVAVDGAPTASIADLEAALARARGQHRASVLCTVRRGAHQGHVPVAF